MHSFHKLLRDEKILVMPGVFNAASALVAKKEGFGALYLSGSGVATGSFGVPDLGITTLDQVVEEARRIVSATDLPLLVDIDTGFHSIEETIAKMEEIGVSGVHLEDQVVEKRCGHRPGKSVIPIEEMVEKIKCACNARKNSDFFIIARVDSRNVIGFDDALCRAKKYQDAGANAIFAEALESLDEYKKFVDELRIPVLANMTEFGRTPYTSVFDFQSAGVKMVIFPLTAFRAMMKTVEDVYRTLKKEGSQKSILNKMQTREELYRMLNYYEKENKI